MNACSLFIGLFFAGTFKKFTKDKLEDDEFISIVGAISGIFAGTRFQWGPLVEAYSYKLVYGIILVGSIFMAFTFPVLSYYKATLAIYLPTMLLFEGAHFTLMPVMITKLFGNQATMVYGFGFSFSGVCAIITTTLVVFVFKKEPGQADGE